MSQWFHVDGQTGSMARVQTARRPRRCDSIEVGDDYITGAERRCIGIIEPGDQYAEVRLTPWGADEFGYLLPWSLSVHVRCLPPSHPIRVAHILLTD